VLTFRVQHIASKRVGSAIEIEFQKRVPGLTVAFDGAESKWVPSSCLHIIDVLATDELIT